MRKNNVGILGFGTQGQAVANQLKKKGFEIAVYDKNLAFELNTTLKNKDYILLILTAGNAPKELVLSSGFIDHLNPKSMVIEMGSISKEDSLAIGDALNKANISYVESILCGPKAAIDASQCNMLYGGSQSDYNEVKDLLSCIGPLYQVGALGQGAVFNLAVLNMLYALLNSFASSVALIERSDIDMGKWLDYVRGGLGAGENLMPLFTDFFYSAHFKPRDYQLNGPLQFKNDSAVAETKLIFEVLENLGIDSGQARAVQQTQEAAYQLDALADWTSIYDVINPNSRKRN